MLDIVLEFILLISFVLGTFRLYKGPELADRIVALDALAGIVAAFVLLQLYTTGEPIYMDIVVIISLVVFLSTVSISIFLRKKN